MKKTLFIGIIGLLMAACQSPMTVTSDYDRSVDFTKYKTFQMLPWPDELNTVMTESDQALVDNSIKDVLARYGYTYVESGADLVVSSYVHLDEERGVTAYNNYYGPSGYGYYGGFGYGYGYGVGVGVGYSTTTYQEYTITVGSLIIDFYDQSEKKLVWQGIGSDELSDKRSKNVQKIPSYVRQVLYDFPKVKNPK